MLASIWFVIETRPCRITSSVIGSTALWAASCMRALPFFPPVPGCVKHAYALGSAPKEGECFVRGVQCSGAAAQEQRQELAISGHLVATAFETIERHGAAAAAERPFDFCRLHTAVPR